MTPKMMAELTAQVSELVHRYSNDYQQFQCATYNETQVRVDFVNRFFHILGWDVDNERGLPQHLREVTHEATVVVEEDGVHRSKKPDYSFKVGTEVLFFLETKKPAVNITVDSAPAFQLRRYGWSGNLKISVLTNFTDLYIYDCSIRPREGDGIGVAMIAHYHFDEYIERFEEIYNLLSKEAALTGEFENRFENIRRAVRREPFDQYFLSQIKSWRNALGEDILQNNPDVDNETLNIFVQRILNRTIFLRICEDRCLENYESLRNITTYQELKTMFETADRKYDSGLFELLDEDRLIVSDGVLIEIFQSLYYPNNSYEFGVIEPYIIGQIYELFLDESWKFSQMAMLSRRKSQKLWILKARLTLRKTLQILSLKKHYNHCIQTKHWIRFLNTVLLIYAVERAIFFCQRLNIFVITILSSISQIILKMRCITAMFISFRAVPIIICLMR